MQKLWFLCNELPNACQASKLGGREELILLVASTTALAGLVLTSRHGCTKDNLEKEAKCVDHFCKG